MKDPNFDIAFSVGRFSFYWYAILMALGMAVALMISDRRAKGRDIPKDIALDLCILGLPFGLLGARSFACISGAVAWKDFFELSKSGLSFFGGIMAASAAILVYLRLKKVPAGEMMDIAAPGVFAGIGIKVWGDFFNRIHYGPLVEKASHKWFPLATFGNDLKIHYAAFFYEFLLCVVLLVVYYALLSKKVQRKADRFLLMTLGFCLGRFGIDSIRQDLVMAGPLAFDQLCEIALAALCLIMLLLKLPKSAEKAGTDPIDTQVEQAPDQIDLSEGASAAMPEEPADGSSEEAVADRTLDAEPKTEDDSIAESKEASDFSGLQ